MDDMCRFDHALIALEQMKRYLDASPDERPTDVILRDAHEAIHALEEIESKITVISELDNFTTEQVKPLFDKFAESVEAIKGKTKQVETFLTKNKKGLAAIEKSFYAIETLKKNYLIMRAVRNRLVEVDKSLRFKLAQEETV